MLVYRFKKGREFIYIRFREFDILGDGQDAFIQVKYSLCLAKWERLYYLNGDDRFIRKIRVNIQDLRPAFPVIGFINRRFFSCITIFITAKLYIGVLLVFTVQPGEVPGLVPCF